MKTAVTCPQCLCPDVGIVRNEKRYGVPGVVRRCPACGKCWWMAVDDEIRIAKQRAKEQKQ